MNLLNAGEYIENFLKIRDKSGKIVPLKLNPPQQRLYSTIREQWKARKPVRIIILKARQMGFSTLTEAIIFWYTVTSEQSESLIVAHQEESTGNLFRMSKRFLDELPGPLKPMTRASNGQELNFDRPSQSRSQKKGLGSRIRCATAGGRGIGRSYTLSCLHLSEFAFWPGDKQETLTGLMQAVPDKAGTIVIMESTANGYDAFKDIWDRAVERQRTGEDGFIPVFFPWYEMPEYEREVPPGFRRTPEEAQLAEAFGLSDRQLSWRRWCIENNCNGDLNLFKQEYPATPDEAFIATGACVFDKEAVVLRREQVRKDAWETGEFKIERAGGRIKKWEWQPDERGPIRIRKKPEAGRPYVIGGDTAGEGSDWFVGQVLDNVTGEQVAVLRHQYGEREYAEQMYCLGWYYNEALVGIEINYSTYPQKKLEELGYTRFYVRDRVDSFTGKPMDAFGFQTTAKTRPLAVDGLRDVAAHEIGLITDYETLGEMLTFVYDERRRPQAEEGAHDDCVMALAIAWYIRPQQRMNVEEPEAEGKAKWTADMWDDFWGADEEGQKYLIEKWGEPK